MFNVRVVATSCIGDKALLNNKNNCDFAYFAKSIFMKSLQVKTSNTKAKHQHANHEYNTTKCWFECKITQFSFVKFSATQYINIRTSHTYVPTYVLGLGIGCNFRIDYQYILTD